MVLGIWRRDKTGPVWPTPPHREALLALRSRVWCRPSSQSQGLSHMWGVQTVDSWLPQALFMLLSRAGAALFSQGVIVFLSFVFASHSMFGDADVLNSWVFSYVTMANSNFLLGIWEGLVYKEMGTIPESSCVCVISGCSDLFPSPTPHPVSPPLPRPLWLVSFLPFDVIWIPLIPSLFFLPLSFLSFLWSF